MLRRLSILTLALLTLIAGAVAAQERPSARLAGDSRFDTAIAISQDTFPDGSATVYLARAVDPLVDAVAGGSLRDGPVLLVPPDGELPAQVATEIDRLSPGQVIALGGPTAISQAVVDQAADGRPTSRLAGDSRFDTAIRIAQTTFPDGADTVYIARAVDPLVDAVAGGSLTDGPILLVPPTGDLPAQVGEEIDRLGADIVIALGGPAAVGSDVLEQAAVIAGSASRLQGDSRFDTAIRIAQRTFPNGSDQVYLARAVEPLVDAVAGGSLTDGPVVLVPPTGTVPAQVIAEIERLEPSTVIALGGPGAISQEVLDQAAGRQAPAEVSIVDVRPDAPGNDIEAYNDSEYVELRNDGDATVDISGWQIFDRSENFVTVGQGFSIPAGAMFRVYSGPGDTDPTSRFYADRDQAYLNNSGGDDLRLLDATGQQVATFSY